MLWVEGKTVILRVFQRVTHFSLEECLEHEREEVDRQHRLNAGNFLEIDRGDFEVALEL